ncbi:MAG TPA: carboxypeptidase-like regulatory domain-containing protein, partial [Chitinophagaceae bacterium]|nr:carboxypeptidase-like regulatory domain-containing protein [Chitinophagaceae bacterium]
MLTMYLYTFAQQENCLSTLHLKILDASSGIGIEDVTAYIPQQQKGNHSNQTGELSIEKLCTGEYTLICKHLNHEEKKEKINIKAGDN